ncbi:diguanylate cyclase domain-containing protein [Anaerostipes sp.]|uniref:diguanylate cyclase domain-containing protein n=1 Tax=Anaerostipes sp. TaxID=1872530 RepID=UPI0025BC2EA7|nr:diguanylate cyclase [Anaerostipes sp.]MBS7007735.1 diguanylate cyclase [Anaerostipes sp.]
MAGRDTILIVDDMEINRVILRGVFETDYNLLEAENGQQALVLLEQYHGRIAAMLLDLVMPVKDGYQVLSEIGQNGLLAEFPVVVITAEDSVENEVQVFDLGASEIIMKPFEPHVVKRRVQNIAELNLHRLNQEELIEEQAARLRESNSAMIDALSSIIEYRSAETGQHIRRIRIFTEALLEDVAASYPEYGLSTADIQMIVSASSMHDIGKIAIPDAILNKPGRLTKEEFQIMKTHSVKGCEILEGLDRMSDRNYLRYAYNICRYHHERWDGKGYPDGLRADSIPICAQVVGIADCYDALTTDRVYKKAIAPEQAFTMILNGECGAFSPKLLECFKNVKDIFAEYSRKYADKTVSKTGSLALESSEKTKHTEAMDTLQIGQAKYFTLLRYVDSTVMEVDMGTGVYHLVYASNGNFKALKAGDRFDDSIRHFALHSLHPEDRENALELLGPGLEAFFEDGLMKESRKFRVYNVNLRDYSWCECTVMRISDGHPYQRKVLLIWKDIRQSEDAGDSRMKHMQGTGSFGQLLGGIQQCLNDKYFTMLQINEGLENLLGYKAEEIKEKFHSRYLELIYPADREEVLDQTKKQLNSGNAIELEYRVTAKGGQIIWVLDKSHLVTGTDGKEHIFRTLINVTKSKQAQEELRLTLERHKIIMDQSNDVIFEWDMKKDKMLYSSNWENKFGYVPVMDQASSRLLTQSHIHPQDLELVGNLLGQLGGSMPYGEIEFRLADREGTYRWYKAKATAQYDRTGKPFKAVGIMTDIDAEKKASQALEEKASRDELTGLYNRSTARNEIDHYLENRKPEEMAAMMIIDVDDFKQINDRYGHMFGDAVLQETASVLTKLLRKEDIISRIGGDEFLIFMKDIRKIEILKNRAEKIRDSFQSMFRQDMTPCEFSSSIGIACCPRDGTNFEELFRRSDLALYHTKSKGKNGYCLFDRSLADQRLGFPEMELAASTRIDSSEDQRVQADDLVEQIFCRIYEEEDLEHAVRSILEMAGTKFSVSRAYIYEESEDGIHCRKTFEWCSQGINPQAGPEQNCLYDRLSGRYRDNFNEYGIFYCPDITQLPRDQREALASQGIKSTLQCVIKDGGLFKGFVGFDECVIRRMWTKEQINTLTLIAKLLSIFLLKKRAQDRAEETAASLMTALDNQNAWIYVIDPDSFRLLYMNQQTLKAVPNVKTGMFCYEVFFGRTEPCEKCPAKNISENVSRSIEVYNPILKAWTIADASMIRWRDKEACMLSCHDISRYKDS